MTRWQATLFLAACSVLALAATLTVPVDEAVAKTNPNNPYSPVWFLLNPLRDTQLPYRAYLTAFTAISLAGMLVAHQFWVLPFGIARLQVSAQLALSLLHWHENLTVVAFAWTAWYARPLAALALQKLPVGWSWNLKDAHYQCLNTCFTNTNGTHPTNGIFDVWTRGIGHVTVYALLLIVVFVPVLNPRLKPKLKETTP